jgi:hypothetical protein
VGGGQNAYVAGAVVGGADVLFTNENGVVKRRDSAGANLQTYSCAAGTPDGPVALGGAKIFAAITGLGVVSSTATGSALTGLYTQALGITAKPYWVKSRLIVTRGVNVYELAPDGSTSGGNLDTATPLYTHPDTGWTWSSVTESPSAILAAGYSNGFSQIYRFALEDAASGGTPELSQAYPVAEFPVGEEVLSLRVYLGRYIGIGTTKGLRIGIVGDNGDLQHGPLIAESGPVRSLAAADRFIYGAVTTAHPDGKSGLIVVDLSEEVEDNTLRFPYAWHARSNTTGRVDSVTTLGASGRVAFGVFGEGVYLQSATLYETEGWVRTGRIRYATVEQKKFRTADLGVDIPDGQIGLYVVDSDGDETYVRNLTNGAQDGRGISLASAASQVYEYLQFRLRLTASTDTLTTPALDSVQIKAVPVVSRRELIQYPLLCMDREASSTGVKYGREGYAFARFSALKSLEQSLVVVTITDTTTGETYQGEIQQVEFRRPGPKSADGKSNFGGFLQVLVKK